MVVGDDWEGGVACDEAGCVWGACDVAAGWPAAGCDGCDVCDAAAFVACVSAGCCATALSESSRKAVTIEFHVRMTLISLSSLVRQVWYAKSSTPTEKLRARWQ